jgi:bifunctional UDP-N-acetylglucosamine pyrophosphorylase / glucosamine-1-phosphate N-acetyltransferase
MLGIITAAGLGSRMQSDRPKPLTLLPNGESFLSTAIRKLSSHVDELVVITSNAVLTHPEFSKVQGCHYRIQSDPTGMGDAVFCASDLIATHNDLMIMWCDQIGITEETIEKTIEVHDLNRHDNRMTVPLLWKKSRYIHFQLKDNRVEEILQVKEGDIISESTHSDIGLFILSNGSQLLTHWLEGGKEFSRGKVTSEINFLPFLKYLNLNGWDFHKVEATVQDGIGVNTNGELIDALRRLNI